MIVMCDGNIRDGRPSPCVFAQASNIHGRLFKTKMINDIAIFNLQFQWLATMNIDFSHCMRNLPVNKYVITTPVSRVHN